jgi:hypothetical protein
LRLLGLLMDWHALSLDNSLIETIFTERLSKVFDMNMLTFNKN